MYVVAVASVHISFLLLSYDMLYSSFEDYSFEDDGSACECASCYVFMILYLSCSYCNDNSSLRFLFLLLVFVESVSLTLRHLAGNPSRRISLPLYL